MVLRLCLGAMCSTVIMALHIEASQPLRSIRRKNLSTKFLIKKDFYHSHIVKLIGQLNCEDLTNPYFRRKPFQPLTKAFRPINNQQLPPFKPINSRNIDLVIYTKHFSISFPPYNKNSVQNKKLFISTLNERTDLRRRMGFSQRAQQGLSNISIKKIMQYTYSRSLRYNQGS